MTPQNKHKKDIKKWLVQREVELWMKNNKGFMQDLTDIVDSAILFEAKYGVQIGYKIIKTPKKIKRWFDISTIENL